MVKAAANWPQDLDRCLEHFRLYKEDQPLLGKLLAYLTGDREQAEQIFPLCQKWGIAGMKFGFVQTGAHRWTTWIHDAIKKAAEHQLMVNVHDKYCPTGFERTYPNLISMEVIRGNEEFPDATHNTVLPLTRYIAGAGDYTICCYDKRL